MKRLFLIILILVTCTTASAKEWNYSKCSMEFGGLERDYFIYLPDGLPQGAPLVLYLHGYGGGDGNPRADEFCRVADSEKFALCVPVAAKDPQNKYGWNVGYTFQKGYEVDDVEFVCALAGHLQERYNLSRENVFCTGHSNGGEMCYLLAYRKPGFFRALAPLSGLTMEWMYKELVPSGAVPLCEIHGTEDRVSEWNGDLNDRYWGHYISVPIAVSNWVVTARCTHEITTVLPPVCEHSKKVIEHRFVADDNGGVEVRLYEIIGGGHGLPTEDFDYPATVWEFFSKYLIK